MENIEDVVKLWSTQIREHCHILFLALEEPKFEARAAKLEKLFQRRIMSKPTLTAIVDDCIDFKHDILDALDGGEVIGDVYPGAVKHMIDEELFFLEKLDGKMTPKREIDFWMKESAEHTALAAHLLDPSHGTETKDALKLSDYLKSSKGPMTKLDAYSIAKYYGDDLLSKIEEGTLSTINDRMTAFVLKHEGREVAYGEERLKQLLKS